MAQHFIITRRNSDPDTAHHSRHHDDWMCENVEYFLVVYLYRGSVIGGTAVCSDDGTLNSVLKETGTDHSRPVCVNLYQHVLFLLAV